MKTAVIKFPGSNCDEDCFNVSRNVFGNETSFVWHKEQFNEKDFELVILPGGFSYGDYLRCGAIARFSPVMNSVIAHVKRGGYALGICNGFQVLTEAHLLPGALIRNTDLKFICDNIFLRVENANTDFTSSYERDAVINIPIAHGEGNYRAEDDVLKKLNDEERVVFRYSEKDGSISESANPNGSKENIAGIISENGRVLGMMPHPERVCESILGGTDGKPLFMSLFNA